jgi:hypothetical protein
MDCDLGISSSDTKGTSAIRFACPVADIGSRSKECIDGLEDDVIAHNCPGRRLTFFTPNQL